MTADHSCQNHLNDDRGRIGRPTLTFTLLQGAKPTSKAPLVSWGSECASPQAGEVILCVF